jgi:hypothetical protein
VIRVYDAAGNVIEAHERAWRRTYSDCQFVSEGELLCHIVLSIWNSFRARITK